MKQLQSTKWVGYTILAALALACGGEPGADELELGAESVSTDPSDVAATPLDVEELLTAPVTGDEMLALDDYFARSSAGKPTSIEGRVLRWDDVWMTVDDVLARAEHLADPTLVEKGYADTGAGNPGTPTAIEFWRPDIGLVYYIIVQDAVPAYVFNAVKDIITEWVSAEVDCLGINTFIVTRQANYNALSSTVKNTSYETSFNFVPIATAPGWPCGSVPNGPKACAKAPAFQGVTVGAQNVTRMAAGSSMHMDSGTFPSTDVPKLKRILRHEFGHTFGFDHQLTSNILIPGTQSCGQCLSEFDSVMRGGGRDSFTTDDKKMLRTLYANVANRDNDDCQYVGNARPVTALP